MEQYVTRIGDVTIQRVIPSGGGPPEPVRVMDGEELLRAVKEEPIDEDEEEGEEETPMEGEEAAPTEDEKVEGKEDQDPEEEGVEEEGVEEEEEEEDEEEEKIIIKAEPQDQEDLLGEGVETEQSLGGEQNEEDVQEEEDKESDESKEKSKDLDQTEEQDEEKDRDSGESSKRKALSENEDEEESSTKKKKVEIDVDLDKKKISNLRRNIREVMDETQLDEATLAAQRQEAERLRRVQDQQKYIREVQRQIQLNRQNSKTQSRVISLLQGGSTSILKSSSVGSNTTATSTGPSTVLVKVGSGQQQVLNRKTLEVLRGGKSVSSSTEPIRTGIARVATANKPAMVTPSVSIAPVKPVVQGDAQKKVPPNDADVVTISSSSDSENDCIVISEGEEEEEEEEEEDDDPTNSGMHTNDLYNIPDEQGRVLINVGKPEDEREIFLAPQIARIIKPHQIGGVRFLFDNVVESIERFNNSTGFGCILAHSMGLGKTLQVVSFCDVFLRETSAKTVMCIMPINTLQNWLAEFNMWLPTDPTTSPLAVHGEVRPRHFGIYVLNDMNKTIASRAKVVEEWYREGGVLLIGYEMYRQLSLKRAARVRKGKKKQVEEDVDDEKNKPLLDAMHEALVKPGPDLVICDEGHRIKNSHASISHALKQIRTKRRVVLTGYPLQNNLLEYWCMVDFVRPNYLGTKTEFSNMFERPIQNGQCIDSTPQDIRLMRYRAHVLHSLLEGFVQRRSHSVLRNSLPQKEEYVLLVRMTPLQRKLYDTFMNEVVRTKAVPNPLKAFAVCCKIWNHPDILYNFLKKKEMDELQDLDLEETAALQQQQTGPNSPRRPLVKEKRGKKEVKKAQVAPIKAEVTSQPQSQPPTPEVKQEDRKFDFPNPGQPGPGYNYYPAPPLYPDVPYQYHRPPYYPGYYPEGPSGPPPPPPPFYHHPPPHYDQGGYPGYYPGYDQPQPPYPKGEEFGKQPWGSPPFTGPPNIKQEKNQAKSPKELESPSKPGFQEFYPKEEKPDVKEEKQTFMCGFSGGQVSFNYRNFPGGYPNYPYPNNEYPGWNKGGFPPGQQGEPAMPGGQAHCQAPQDRHSGSSGNAGSQSNMYSGQNVQENPHRGGGQNQERHNPQHNQSSQHGASDRNQHGLGPDNHPNPSNKDNQHRSHSSQEHPPSSHESAHGNYMNMPSNQKNNEHMRKPLPELMPVNPTMYGNKKHEGNSETLQRNQDPSMKNRNLQDNDQKHLQNVNQPGLFNTHENVRNQHQHFGGRNSHDEFRMQFGSPDRQSGQPNPHEQQSPHNSQSSKNNQPHQQFSNAPGPTDNQSRMQGNTEQNLSHRQNPYNNQQRNDHNIRDHGSNSQNISIQNEQERMMGIHQGMFGNQENQSSHEHSNRPYGSAEHFPPNPMNPYGNKRNELSLAGNHEQGSHPNMGNQQIQEPPRRPSLGHENAHSQSNMFNNPRNDNVTHGFQDHGQINQQNSPAAQEKQEMRNRHHGSHSGTQQMYSNQRNENEAHNQNTKHGTSQNLRGSDLGMHANQEHLSNQGNLGMMSSSSHMFSNQETMQGSQHSMFRGHNQHDGQHRGQNYYGNQYDHNVNPGQDHTQQSNLNNQNVPSNQKRIPVNTDHQSGMSQNLYSNQSDHSVQKMIRSDSNIDSHQMMHSNQERPSNQYMYPPPDNMFHNQHSHHASHDMNPQSSEKQNVQETSNNQHMSRDRMLSNQERQPNAPVMFNNPNVPDLRWHNNPERPLNQQNMYDQTQHSKDDPSNKDKQQYHGNQDYSTHNQQNIYSGQSNQSFHRNPEMHGKSQGTADHDSQYRMDKDRSHIDRNSGMMSGVENKTGSQDMMQGNSHNRQNPQDHNMHNPLENIQNLQAGQNTHGNQHMQRNIPHSNQEQMHNMMVNKPSSHGHSNHPHPGANAQPLNHNQDGSQNMTGMPNYGMQNSPQQSHSSNQHNMQPLSNQNVSRNQLNPLNNQEQQSGSNNPFSDNHNMYSSQYHMQSDQHVMNNQSIHGNQHMKTPHHIQSQTGQNLQGYGNHMSQGNPQGNNGNQGMPVPMQNQGPIHSQNSNYNQNSPGSAMPTQAQHGMPPMNQGHGSGPPNQGQHNSSHSQGPHTSSSMSQGSHGSSSVNQGQHSSSINQGQHGSSPMNQGPHGSSPMGQGLHGSSPMNQGPHGSQYQMHMNQSIPSNQYQNPSPSMHPNKDQNQSSANPGSYSGSHHSNPYLPNSNQQSNPHNIHSEHLGMNQSNSKMGHTQHGSVPPVSHKTQTTPTKNDFQKMQTSPLPQSSPHQQNQPISQQGTQTAMDNSGQTSGPQHRVQNILNFPPGQSQNMSFEPNVIASSKSMSGGQVIQGVQQKQGINVLGKNDDQNRFRSTFNEQLSSNNENFQGNYQKPGFYGPDFQYPYQGQFPYDKSFSEQPGPSGQMFRKDDEKTNEDRPKDPEKKSQENDDMVKTNTTSTSTETDDERKDKKDEDDKGEKKQDAKADSTTPQKSTKEDPGIPYDWATEILKGYTPGDIGASAKMAVFFCILEESIALGDRILVFSQSLFTLNLMEELLQQQLVPGKEDERWAKNTNYYRLDGSTTAMEREKLINEFNSNANLHLFLVSTRAGSLGINLVGANRVIVFDASWNPCHDTQAVCRVYRYGQKKPCFVYRLVTDNCLEKKIYDRQINKQGMSDRVVDECNPDAHLSIKEVTSLCWDDKEDDTTPKDFTSLQDQYIDVVLQKVIQKHSSRLSKEPFAHESLLVDRKEKKLSQAEKRLAKRSYELEKQASTRPIYNGINQNQVRPKPMASVRPMQAEMGQSGRQRGWIPASVWQRQGMSAQEMTLPLDVVIPTNAADRASIVLKAGQKVMVLKSPKGIYMQLENGKIIAIRTAFKVGGKKPGEQVKVNPTEMTPRRGMRQIGAPRGRPIRAVGPVTRPPPVTVTVTKKRLSEDEQSGRKEDESESPESLPTPMEVTESSSTEKEGSSEGDTPNPFTAAAAASLSTMQVSPSGEEHKQIDSPDHMTQTPEKHVSPHPLQMQSHTVSPQLQKPPTPVPVLPQVTISPQPQASVPPLSSKPLATHPQVSVQPLVQTPVNAPLSHASVQPSPSHASRQPSPSHVSSMQPSPSHVTVQPSPSHASVQPSPTHASAQSSPSQASVPPSQSHASIQPSSSHPPVQHPVAHSKTSSVQPHHTVPVTHQPQQPIQVPMDTQTSMQTRSPMHMQHPIQTHHSIQNQPTHPQPIQPQPVYSNQGQVPVSPHSVTPHPHSQSSTSVQSHNQGSVPYSQSQNSVSMQTQASPMMTQPQVSASMQTHSQGSSSVQTSIQTSVPFQTHTSTQASASIQTHSSPSMQSHTQTSSSIQTHPQVPTPLQPQSPVLHPQYSIPPHPQAAFPMQQAHHPHPSSYSMQPAQQKQGHFPSLPPHQFPLPPQQSQYPIAPQQSQFLGHPAHQFPMHPQPQYPIHPQQPYPVQPQPQYPIQPHLQQPQFGGQPPHQFPLHPQPQFPMQPPSQFDQAAPVPSSMMTDHLS